MSWTLPRWLEVLAGGRTSPSAAETCAQGTLLAQFPPPDLPGVQQMTNKSSLFFNAQHR